MSNTHETVPPGARACVICAKLFEPYTLGQEACHACTQIERLTARITEALEHLEGCEDMGRAALVDAALAAMEALAE
jgi:hypothetical protein